MNAIPSMILNYSLSSSQSLLTGCLSGVIMAHIEAGLHHCTGTEANGYLFPIAAAIPPLFSGHYLGAIFAAAPACIFSRIALTPYLEPQLKSLRAPAFMMTACTVLVGLLMKFVGATTLNSLLLTAGCKTFVDACFAIPVLLVTLSL